MIFPVFLKEIKTSIDTYFDYNKTYSKDMLTIFKKDVFRFEFTNADRCPSDLQYFITNKKHNLLGNLFKVRY